MGSRAASSGAELIGLLGGRAFSPWLIRARWALLEARVPFFLSERAFDEQALKARLGLDKAARLSYPVLVLADGQAFTESLDIAKYAARRRPELFPEGADVDGWVHKADSVAWLARAQLAWVREQEDLVLLMAERLPQDEPLWVRKEKARQRLDQVTMKYSQESLSQGSDEVFAILRELQGRLTNHEFLVSHQLSYADICMTTALYMVMSDGHPLVDPGMPPIGRSPFAQSIRHEFPLLMAWADNLFNEHLPQEMRARV
jgi:glutathione S-transferase